MPKRRFRSIALPLLALGLAAGGFGAWLARAASGPAVIETLPPNPAAGQAVVVRDASPRGSRAGEAAPFPGSWWDFGDGHSSESPAPVHVWEEAGEYVVRLVSPGGAAESSVVVSSADTLRLLGTHPFEVTLEVRDPRTGGKLDVRASAWTDG